jgi:hypothetical protein
LVAFTLVFSITITPVTAETNEKSEKQIVKELLDDGLTKDEAVYYAKLQKLIEKLEKEKSEIDVSDAPDISDEYARTHPNELRQKILNLDPAAIKKGLKSLAEKNGTEYLEKVISEDRKNNSVQKRYEVKYPDGSSVIVTGHLTKDEDTKDGSVSTNTRKNGPWNGSQIDWAQTVWDDGSYTASHEWKYSSGVSYSKIAQVTRFNYSTNGTSKDYNDDTVNITQSSGSEASYGVVQIHSYDNDVIAIASAKGWDWAQAYAQVLFQVTGSFSASYKELSINVDGGAQWTQFAVVEIQGIGAVEGWSAQYK